MADGALDGGTPTNRFDEIIENQSDLAESVDGRLDGLERLDDLGIEHESLTDSVLRDIHNDVLDDLDSSDQTTRENAEAIRDYLDDHNLWDDDYRPSPNDETDEADPGDSAPVDEKSDDGGERPTDNGDPDDSRGDPLIIDLDGDGVELSSLGSSDVYFDLDGNGFAENTGWVSPNDGLLVRDINDDGAIVDVSELFGDTDGHEDGFSSLASLDENEDGKIDASDGVFGELKVWRDLDQDGESDDGELFTLEELKIESISLDTNDSQQTVEGHLVTKSSAVTFSDGSERSLVDVFFETDPYRSVASIDPNFEYHVEALHIPQLFGTGNVAHTAVALTEDSGLREQARNLLELLEQGRISEYHEAFDDFFLSWTGADTADADGRGEYVNGQQLAALEALFGQEYTLTIDRVFRSNNPDEASGPELTQIYEDQRDWFSIRFISQSAAASTVLDVIDGGYTIPEYDEIVESFTSHPMSGFSSLVDGYNSSNQSLNTDLPSVLRALSDLVASNLITVPEAVSIGQLLRFDFGPSQAEFTEAVLSAGPESGVDFSDEFYVRLAYGTHEFVAGDDEENILSVSDGPAYLRGHEGNDSLSGSDNFVIFDGGGGDDMLNGGNGENIYIYRFGDGDDVITDRSSQNLDDRLVFTDVHVDDVTFSQNAGKDLVITLSNGETVTVTDHFENDQEDMELIEFADGTVLDLAAITAKTISDQNGSGDDLVLGSNGNDRFFGGEGNDTLNGGNGADTYLYSLGDGDDVITDRSSQNLDDRLVFTDVHVDDVTFSQNAGKDLVITLSNGETVTVTDHFENDQEDMELIEFADGTVLDLAAITAKTISDQNGSGDDLVLGSNGNDRFFGGEGNDTLNGGNGADTYLYSLGDGDDVITDRSSQNLDDRLVFTDVHVDDVTFSQNAGKDLVITLSNGETVTVTDHFENDQEDMELIEFADGTVLDLAAITEKAISDQNGAGDDLVLGSYGNDRFFGGEGNDTLNGGSGADTYLYSLGDGNDVIADRSSQELDDRLVFTDVNVEDVTFSQNAGKDLVITLSNGETVTVTDHFENDQEDMELIEFADGTVLDLTDISAKSISDQVGDNSGDDTIVGTSGDDNLDGGAGNDRIDGGSGADTHNGGAGDDYLIGNTGADLFDGGEGADTLDFTYSSNGYTIDLSQSTAVFTDGFVEQVLNIENVIAGRGHNTLIGSDADNFLDGGRGNDTLSGGNGNDQLEGGDGDDNHQGGAGNDTLFGSIGDDFFDGGEGIDTLDFSYSSNHFTVDLSQSKATFSDGFVEQVTNIENLVGGSGNNTLIGSNADNQIDGGTGNDTLTGGLGVDTFVFGNQFGSDQVTDFEDGADRLKLDIEGVSFGDVVISDASGDAQITVANHGTVILHGVNAALLSEDDFLF
ncbi:M10 family metallopeptidase C-terminal domain-containing protein [Leisingera sp. S132]|uniref:calcium-binding protein n=1 Tax=Leisingera sp. S132 TaxID=2867016 RepID=UPI0021A26DBE|nr:calcium-binding protein [Leisingera sp. S132]UWQ79044.1 M10 family metallopeptidase C-terminal domain-containing protein [Leisingera sp. S132]